MAGARKKKKKRSRFDCKVQYTTMLQVGIVIKNLSKNFQSSIPSDERRE